MNSHELLIVVICMGFIFNFAMPLHKSLIGIVNVKLSVPNSTDIQILIKMNLPHVCIHVVYTSYLFKFYDKLY